MKLFDTFFLKSKLTRFVDALCRRVILVSDDVYELRLNSEFELYFSRKVSQRSAAWVVLVSPSQCFTQIINVPASSHQEARRILKLMPLEAPFESPVRRVRVREKEQAFVGEVSMIPARLLDACSGRRSIVIPLSWFFDDMRYAQATCVTMLGEELLIRPGSLFSSIVPFGREWATEAALAEPTDYAEITINETELGARIVKFLLSLSFIDIRESKRTPELRLERFMNGNDWRSMSKLVATAALAYFTIISLLLVATKTGAEAYLSREPPAFTKGLQLRADIISLQGQAKQWQGALGTQSPTWVVWPPLEDAISMGADILSVEVMGDEVTARMRAANAADILEMFMDNDFVSSPQFDSSVRASANEASQVFGIKWRLLDEQSQ